MDSQHILEMISYNRKYLRLRSNIALQNLAMLHRSFDAVLDEECTLALALNDSLAAQLFSFSSTTAIHISQSVVDRYPDSPYTYLLAEHENLIGRNYIYLTCHEYAQEHLQRAEVLAYSLPDIAEVRGLRADILHNLAMNTHHIVQGSEMVEAYLTRALAELEGTEYDNRRGMCYIGMSNVRLFQKRYEDALNYNLKALPLFEDDDNFGNISSACCNIGNCLAELGRYEESEVYLMRSLDLRSRLGSYSEIAHIYYQIARLRVRQGDIEAGYEQMLISRDYALMSQSLGIQRMILEELGELSVLRGDSAAADTHRTRLKQIESIAA